jgi:hypothetical protein
MKKLLLALIGLAALAAAPAKSAPFWYDVITNYSGGCITTNTTLWFPHAPGSGLDALIITNAYTSGAAVSGKHLRVSGLNSEYIERWLDLNGGTTNTYGGGVLWVSFIANGNFVPAFGGTYFAHLMDGGSPLGETNAFLFRGRIFQIATTNIYPYTNTMTGTYQFGVANAANDLTTGGGGPILTVPIDMAKNVDYQVVMKYDLDNVTATIWVNPASESDVVNCSGIAFDFGPLTNTIAALGFRQRTGGGTVDIRDVAVGLTFADVVTNTPGPVLVATNYNTVTNFIGNPALLEVFASSIGGGALSYQWYRISGGVTNAVGASSGSQKLFLPAISAGDEGAYFCAVTNSGGIGAVSGSDFYIAVNTTPTAPTFTVTPPTNVTATIGTTLTLSAAASGSGPLNFVWKFNGNPLTDGQPVTGNPGDQSVVAGAGTPTLTVSGLSTNETGTFSVTVTGSVAPAASANTAVSVTLAKAVNIAYLRSLLDTNTWQVTNFTSIYAVSNCVITVYTNTTSGVTASYYMQDDTAGINLFVTGDASFRPTLGDIVNASGTLSSYNNSVELAINSSNPYQYYHVVGHTNVVPAPVVFAPFSLTNNASLMETNIEGRLIMFTNVYFTAGLTTPSGNGSLYVTNASGGIPFQLFFPGGTDLDTRSQVINSRFAWTITGVASQYKSGTNYSASGYELIVTRFGDIVTNPPPAVTSTAVISGADVNVTWAAVPYTPDTRGAYAYSVLAATNVAGPYLPLATGLTFNTTNGVYKDAGAGLGTLKFYRVSSP